ncbi:MAG: protease complex subunit PrcB family protein [Bacteroidetes bacterium]|nr:protease complex subunit PrcB family protein [Bacteroidota bacterium]
MVLLRHIATLLLCCTLVGLMAGCGEEAPTPEPIFFEPLGTGVSATFNADTTEVVVRTAEAWEAIREQMRPPQPFGPVDFDEDIVVVLARQAPTGGYSVDIRRVERVGEEVVVRYVWGVPENDCITIQGKTTPFRVVAFERVDGAEVRFESRRQTYRCSPRGGL